MARGRVWELCIYAGGTALLADETGQAVWASDEDDDFALEFDEVLTYDDGEAIAGYLEENDILPRGIALDIVESDDTGLHEVITDDIDDLEGDDDEDEDDE